MKLRIIEIIQYPGAKGKNNQHSNYFIIEQKHLFRWKQIKVIDIHESTKSYHSYLDAEKDIYENYMNRWGECIKNGNVYTWKPYSFWG